MSPAPRKESPDVFKPAQPKPSHALLLELACRRCGVILFVEPPKGESTYPCVCGANLDIVVTRAA